MSSFNWADAEDDEEFRHLPQETTTPLSSTQASSISAPAERSRQADSSAWRRSGFSSSSSSDRYSHTPRSNVQESRGYVSRNSNVNRCNYESRFEGRPPNQCPEGEKPFVLHLSADRLRSKDDVTRSLTQFIRYPYAFESMTLLSDRSVPTWELVFSQWRSLSNAYNVSLQDDTVSAQVIGQHNQQVVHDYFHGPPPVIKPVDKSVERGFGSSAFGGFRGDRSRDAAPMFTPEPEPEADERLLAWARRRAAEPEPAAAPRGSGYRDGERRERSGFGFRGDNSEHSGSRHASGHASGREGERERVGAGKTEQATSWRQTPREDVPGTGSAEDRGGDSEHGGEGTRAGVMGGRAVRVLQREQMDGGKDRDHAEHSGTGTRGGVRGRGDPAGRSDRGDRGAASTSQTQANTPAPAAAQSWRRASTSEEGKKGGVRDSKETRDAREGKDGREGRDRDGKGASRPDKNHKAEDKASGDEEGSGEGKGRRRRHHARGDRGLGRGRSNDRGNGHAGPRDGNDVKDGAREGTDVREGREGRDGGKNSAVAASDTRTGKFASEGGSDRSHGRFGKPAKDGKDVRENKDGKAAPAAVTAAEASAPQEREKRGERQSEGRTEGRGERRGEEGEGAFPRSRGYRGRGRGRVGEERK